MGVNARIVQVYGRKYNVQQSFGTLQLTLKSLNVLRSGIASTV